MLSTVESLTASPFVRDCSPDSPDIESKLLESELTLKVNILHIIPLKDPRFYQASANVTSVLNGKFNFSSTQGLILIEPFSNQTLLSSSCVGPVHKDGNYIIYVNSSSSTGYFTSLFPPELWDEEKEEHIKAICHDCDHADDGRTAKLPPLVACGDKMAGFCLNGGTCYHLATDENETLCRCTRDYIGTRCEVFSFVDFARSHDKKIQDEIRSIALQFFLYGVALVVIAVIILFAVLFCFYRCIYRPRKRRDNLYSNTEEPRMPSKYVQVGQRESSMSPSNTLRNNPLIDDTASLLSKSSYTNRHFQTTNFNEPKQLNGDAPGWFSNGILPPGRDISPTKPLVELVKGPSSRRGSHGSVPSNLMRTTPLPQMENGYGQLLPGSATPNGRKPYSTLPVRDY